MEVTMIQYLNPNRYKNTSRYAKLRLIQKNNEPKSYHEVSNATSDVNLLDCQLFHVVGPYVDRLDLIAKKFYGDASLWWFLAKQNHIEDPSHVPVDSTLEIPKYNTLLTDGRVLEPLSYVYLNLGVE
jgi:hypothetical protein